MKSNRWNPLKKQGHLKQTGEISWTRYPSAYKKLCSDSIHGSISRAWSQIPTAHNKYTAENLKTTLSPKSKEISPNCNEIPLYIYIYMYYMYIIHRNHIFVKFPSSSFFRSTVPPGHTSKALMNLSPEAARCHKIDKMNQHDIYIYICIYIKTICHTLCR